MAIIFEFGQAPAAAAKGYKLVKVIEGTADEVLKQFDGIDAILVKSAALFGQGTACEFGVFMKRPIQRARTQHTFVRKTGEVVTVDRFMQGPRLQDGYEWRGTERRTWVETPKKEAEENGDLFGYGKTESLLRRYKNLAVKPGLNRLINTI